MISLLFTVYTGKERIWSFNKALFSDKKKNKKKRLTYIQRFFTRTVIGQFIWQLDATVTDLNNFFGERIIVLDKNPV